MVGRTRGVDLFLSNEHVDVLTATSAGRARYSIKNSAYHATLPFAGLGPATVFHRQLPV